MPVTAAAGIVNDAACIVTDATGIVSDTAGNVSGAVDIVSDTAGIEADAAHIVIAHVVANTKLMSIFIISKFSKVDLSYLTILLPQEVVIFWYFYTNPCTFMSDNFLTVEGAIL